MICECGGVVLDPVTNGYALQMGGVFYNLPQNTQFCPCCGGLYKEVAMKDWRDEYEARRTGIKIAVQRVDKKSMADASRTVLSRILEDMAGGVPCVEVFHGEEDNVYIQSRTFLVVSPEELKRLSQESPMDPLIWSGDDGV